MSAFAVASGIVIALIAHTGFAALPASFGMVALLVGLLAWASAAGTGALLRVFGPLGVSVASIVMLILGNATSGGILPTTFLPGWLSPLAHTAAGSRRERPARRGVLPQRQSDDRARHPHHLDRGLYCAAVRARPCRRLPPSQDSSAGPCIPKLTGRRQPTSTVDLHSGLSCTKALLGRGAPSVFRPRTGLSRVLFAADATEGAPRLCAW